MSLTLEDRQFLLKLIGLLPVMNREGFHEMVDELSEELRGSLPGRRLDTQNPFTKEYWNLTAQSELIRFQPEKAMKLQNASPYWVNLQIELAEEEVDHD